MNCWKCGERTEEGQVECDKCAQIMVTHEAPPDQVLIDWSKVTSFEDMKTIMSEVAISVTRGSATWQKLRRWLKD